MVAREGMYQVLPEEVKLKNPLIYWTAFLLGDILLILVLIVTKFNYFLTGINCLVLACLSSVAILKSGDLGFKFKLGMALGLPFKYFILGIFSFSMPYFGTSEIPVFIFFGLFLASIIGSPIAMRYTIKSQKPNG